MGPFHPISQIKHSHWDSVIVLQSVEPQIYSTVRFLFYFCVCKGRCRRSRLQTLLLNESSKFDHFMAYRMQCFPHFMSPFNTESVMSAGLHIIPHNCILFSYRQLDALTTHKTTTTQRGKVCISFSGYIPQTNEQQSPVSEIYCKSLHYNGHNLYLP